MLLGQSLHHQHLAPRVIYPSQAAQHCKALRRLAELRAQLLRAQIRPTDLWGGEASGGLQGRGQQQLDVELVLYACGGLGPPVQHLQGWGAAPPEVQLKLCGQLDCGSPSKQPVIAPIPLAWTSRQKPQKTFPWPRQVPAPPPVQQLKGCPAAVHCAFAL